VSIGLAISITQDPRFHFEPDEGGSLLTYCPPNSPRSRKRLTGWVAEWSKAVVLRSAVRLIALTPGKPVSSLRYQDTVFSCDPGH
jgi:hypothetical protein